MQSADRSAPEQQLVVPDDALVELKQVYLAAAEDDVRTLEREIGKTLADHSLWPKACEEMRRVTHNVKGQGTSFGFPLMTAVGNSLSTLLKAIKVPDEPALRLIEAHVSALHLVLSQRIEGSGGSEGAELTRRLEALVEPYIA